MSSDTPYRFCGRAPGRLLRKLLVTAAAPTTTGMVSPSVLYELTAAAVLAPMLAR